MIAVAVIVIVLKSPIRDGPVNHVGRGEWKNDFRAIFFFFAAIIGLQFFFLGMCRAIFFLL